MGHSIRGFIARAAALKAFADSHEEACFIPLPQDFGFVPLTEALFDKLTAGDDFLPDICDERFGYLNSKIFQIGRRLSKETPFAYIETDYFGGEGFQCGVAWSGGDVGFGPQVTGREEGYQIDSYWAGAVNGALREIGVENTWREDGPDDEFGELDLGKFRSNEAWIEQAGKLA